MWSTKVFTASGGAVCAVLLAERIEEDGEVAAVATTEEFVAAQELSQKIIPNKITAAKNFLTIVLLP
jgi:hypothetical protein